MVSPNRSMWQDCYGPYLPSRWCCNAGLFEKKRSISAEVAETCRRTTRCLPTGRIACRYHDHKYSSFESLRIINVFEEVLCHKSFQATGYPILQQKKRHPCSNSLPRKRLNFPSLVCLGHRRQGKRRHRYLCCTSHTIGTEAVCMACLRTMKCLICMQYSRLLYFTQQNIIEIGNKYTLEGKACSFYGEPISNFSGGHADEMCGNIASKLD